MTTIVSKGQVVPVEAKAAPFPTSRPTTSGPNPGSLPLLRLDGQTATYEWMWRSQPWVYAVVMKYVYGIARLPLHSYVQAVDERQRDRDSGLAAMLAAPLPRWSPFAWKATMVWNLMVHGHALAVKFRPGPGQPPSELWPVPWRYVQTVEDESGVIGYALVFQGRPYALTPDDVLHLSLPGGVSPMEPLRRTLAVEDAAIEYQGNSFVNGLSIRGAFTTDQRLNDSTIPRLRAELTAQYSGAENAGQFGIFDQGLKWQQMAMTAAEAGLIDTRRLTREEVCGVYDMAPPLVGILDRATYSNITQLHSALYVDTFGPKTTMIEEAFHSQVVADVAAWNGLDVEFLLDEVLRPDPEARHRIYLMAQQSGTLTINERRKMENLPPLDDPLADAVSAPLNMNPVGANVTPEPTLREKVDMVGALIRAGFDPGSAASAVGLPPMEYLDVQPVTVRPVAMLDAQTEQITAAADATGSASTDPAKDAGATLAETLALEAYRTSVAVSQGQSGDEPSTVSDREG